MRIVDEALPADGGARLLEVNAHYETEVAREFGLGGLEKASVFESGPGVVNGTGADHDQQAAVAAIDDRGDLFAELVDGGRGLFGCGEFFLQEGWRQQD